jgi:uncharacterized protein YacL
MTKYAASSDKLEKLLTRASRNVAAAKDVSAQIDAEDANLIKITQEMAGVFQTADGNNPKVGKLMEQAIQSYGGYLDKVAKARIAANANLNLVKQQAPKAQQPKSQ